MTQELLLFLTLVLSNFGWIAPLFIVTILLGAWYGCESEWVEGVVDVLILLGHCFIASCIASFATFMVGYGHVSGEIFMLVGGCSLFFWACVAVSFSSWRFMRWAWGWAMSGG